MQYARAVVLWGLCTSLVSVSSAWADGVVRDGVGAISTGRGGTNIGHSDTGAIILDNPAGMVNVEGSGLFEIGVDGLITDLDYSDPENDTHAEFRPMALPELAYIRKSGDGNWAFGLGIFAPAGFGATWELDNALFGPDEHGYKSLGALGKILPSVAYRVTDQLSIGAAFGVAITHAELEGPFFLQNPSPSPPLVAGIPTRFDLQATGAAPTWSAGLQYRLTDRTTFGLTYVDETRFRLDGDLDAQIFGLGPGPVPSNFDAQADLVWPRSVGLGVRHDLRWNHRVSADVIWFDWSHAFDQVDLKLTDPTSAAIAGLAGPVIRESLPLDWNDSVSVRVGYEWFFTPLQVFRLGYVYHASPIPDSTLTPYIPAILEHAVAVGYGKQWTAWRCDLAYQYSFGPEADVTRGDLAGGDFNFSEVEAQAHWISLSFTRRF